jgi:molecular chaperone GrpE
MAAVESAGEPNTVVNLVLKGYRLHDRVVRPALLTVSKALENKEKAPTSDANPASN